MDEVVQVAFIVASGTAISAAAAALSPIIQARLVGKQRALEREEDFARQDAVAKKADEVAIQAANAARLLRDAQQVTIQATEKVAEATKEVARTAAISAAETHTQLNQIHTMVNSNLTAAWQSDLDQAKATLAVMREMAALKRSSGVDITPESLAAVASTEARIAELEATLADRLLQMKSVEAEAAAAAAAAAA